MGERRTETCRACGGSGEQPCRCTKKEKHTTPCRTCNGRGVVVRH